MKRLFYILILLSANLLLFADLKLIDTAGCNLTIVKETVPNTFLLKSTSGVHNWFSGVFSGLDITNPTIFTLDMTGITDANVFCGNIIVHELGHVIGLVGTNPIDDGHCSSGKYSNDACLMVTASSSIYRIVGGTRVIRRDGVDYTCYEFGEAAVRLNSLYNGWCQEKRHEHIYDVAEHLGL